MRDELDLAVGDVLAPLGFIRDQRAIGVRYNYPGRTGSVWIRGGYQIQVHGVTMSQVWADALAMLAIVVEENVNADVH